MPAQIDPEWLAKRLRAELTRGLRTGPDLQAALGVSQPTVSRALKRLGEEVVRLGHRRGAQYGLRRPLDLAAQPIPLFAVNAQGTTRELGGLSAVEPHGFVWTRRDQRPRFSARLPWFVSALMPLHQPSLDTEAALALLTKHGFNKEGQLILGVPALEQFVAQAQKMQPIIAFHDRAARYQALADAKLREMSPESGATERSRFLTRRECIDGDASEVLVKFSPPTDTPAGRRVAHLLVAEHLALQTLRDFDLNACESELVFGEERTFLERVRFDRVGEYGRRGVFSLQAALRSIEAATGPSNAHSNGDSKAAISALVAAGRVTPVAGHVALEQAQQVTLFGQLIADSSFTTDRFAFFADGLDLLRPTPIFGVHPALFAPQNGEVVTRAFVPPIPRVEHAPHWRLCYAAARDFWGRLGASPHVDRAFQRLAIACWSALGSYGRAAKLLPVA